MIDQILDIVENTVLVQDNVKVLHEVGRVRANRDRDIILSVFPLHRTSIVRGRMDCP